SFKNDRRTSILHSQYYEVLSNTSTNNNNNNNSTNNDHDENNENSPIKSASYMDELRQRLERVLN
ncbi:unnamed protein product, partial [Rotaria magnacalcarata]